MSDFGIDLEEVYRVIDNAEVLIVRFALIDHRLLLDAREDPAAGPVLRVVPKATSIEERFRSIRKLRPGLSLPERIMSFQWPRHVSTLRDAGIWKRFEQRCGADEHDQAKTMCEEAWQELLKVEQGLVRNAIVGGQGFQTIWPPESA